MTRRRLAGLAVFVLANGLALNALLFWSAPDSPRGAKATTLAFTRAYLRGEAGSDSWTPMRRALAYLAAPHAVPVYSELLLERGVKFQYPPTSLLLLQPLLRLPNPGGDALLNAISWLAVAVLGLLVARIFLLAVRRAAPGPGDRAEAWMALAIAAACTLTFYPVMRAYHIGQIQTWINPLFAGAVWAWMRDRRLATGALFGAICAVKPALAPLLVWGLLRREWRFLAGFAAVIAPLALASLALYGWNDCADYWTALAYLGRHGESFHQNQSANGLLHRMLFNGNNLVWSGNRFPPFHPAVYAGTIASSLLLVGAALFWRRRDARAAPLEDLLIASLSFSMAAPIVWDHHYGATLPVFAAALPAALAPPRPHRGALVALGAAFALLANRYRLLEAAASTPFNFLQSTLFFGALLLLAVLYRQRRARAREAVREGAAAAAPSEATYL